jgi:hypothetical protein
MTGYKATYNGKCLNIVCEIGKTYTFNGNLMMHEQGFNFCKNLHTSIGMNTMEKEI